MTGKKKFIIALGVFLAVALVAGITTIAVTSYGSQNDPLVTLSYLNDTVTPGIMNQLQTELNAKADELSSDFNALIASQGTGTAPSGFSVISLTNGQTLTCSVGTEIMLRIGTAVTAGVDAPRLIDETTGSSVSAAGTALEKNHMYMVTIKGNGIKATSNVKVLIRGEYTIG